ncbi:DNA-binding transcriptional MerR regulator [Lewinella aquimaris]|uniref:DNA-binding transcriptional MerR regulator n=1 Tax=Neolewinella aquimaris TaxID=1835722 RepID=A0A840E3E9_9BACT|nr:MerR family transcriptional regulator [Neolewinella aquimaris]MBB4079731.1 DNA-binding transcriptional MerR regulator [Neolewinella aquimaris]
MAVYSINDVENLTGIRAHTLRAWEQRYDLIAPRRSKHNVRFYLDEDLRELTTIALLNKNGYRISKIAAMSPTERAELVTSLSALNVSPETQLDALTLAVVELNEYKFSLILDTNIGQRGFEETMMEVVYPFLDKLGVLYFTGSVTAVQESFVGGLIRQKILSATDHLPAIQKSDRTVFALFLPKGEQQDLSMLFIQYLLRKRGFHTLYLGSNISPTDLADLCRVTRVDYLLTHLSNSYVDRPVEDLVADILDQCTEARLLLSGYQASLHDLSAFVRVEKVSGLGEILAFLAKLSKREGLSIASGR